MKKLQLFILLALSINLLFGQGIKLIRICGNGLNNNITWRFVNDSCITTNLIDIWASDNLASGFFKLDSNIIAASGLYNHLNANSPSIKDWHYKLTYQKVCGTDTITLTTDTLRVDDEKPDSTVLDSVSIDNKNNTVLLGWSSNKTSDFASYYLYNIDKADPRLIENYRDTFYIDINPVNPKSKSLQYDITSSDSCDNRRDYGKYFHKTIWLTSSIDTCKSEVRLNWTKYVGWETNRVYVFKSINGNPYIMIDSLPGATINYNDITIGSNQILEYFVRAHSLTSSSSSNLTNKLITSKTVSPKNSNIEFITANNKKSINIKIKPETGATYKYFILQRGTTRNNLDSIGQVFPSNLIFEDNIAADHKRWYYRVISKNSCNQYADTSTISGNIVLEGSENLGNKELRWNSYFTWNNPVEKYIINRSSGDNLSSATNFLAINETNGDTNFLDNDGLNDNVKCYYVTAKETMLGTESSSNKICFIKTGEIYYPNAIVIGGINNTFNFVGQSLELDKSNLRVYDRWGSLVIQISNLANGWDGKNINNEFVTQGVFFFQAEIKRGEEVIKLKGTINVIN